MRQEREDVESRVAQEIEGMRASLQGLETKITTLTDEIVQVRLYQKTVDEQRRLTESLIDISED